MIEVDESIVLKDLELEDATELFNIIDSQREYIGRWTVIPDVTKAVGDTYSFIEKTLASENIVKVMMFNGRKVGLIGTSHINNETQTAELGYWLDKNFQGNGIVSKSAEKFISTLFEQGFKQFEIHSISNNARSCKVAENLGFEMAELRYGATTLHGNQFDLYIYRKKSE